MVGLEVVAEHTIQKGILTGYVLDVGCRNFTFAKEMANRRHTVIALDPDPTVDDPRRARIVYERVALRDRMGKAKFEMAQDPQARRLSDKGTVDVDCVTIQDVMKRHWISLFRIVKLDCEGAEMGILESWPGPVSEQITVEFHDHVEPQPQERYDRIFEHLAKWYDCIQNEKSLRHCIGTENRWDSLWVLR